MSPKRGLSRKPERFFIPNSFYIQSRIFKIGGIKLKKGDRVLDFGSGASDFARTFRKKGIQVVAFDPKFNDPQEFNREIKKTLSEPLEKLVRNHEEREKGITAKPFPTEGKPIFSSTEKYIQNGLDAAREFLKDRENKELDNCNYVASRVLHDPSHQRQGLPFRDKTFKLGISSHVILTMADITYKDRKKMIFEGARVCEHFLIAPLGGIFGQRYSQLDRLLEEINAQGSGLRGEFFDADYAIKYPVNGWGLRIDHI